MDRLGIIVITVCVLLMGCWVYENHKIQVAAEAYQLAHPSTNNFVATRGSTNGLVNELPASVLLTPTPTAAPFDSTMPEQTLVLANANARYTFTSRGGGLKLVELLGFPETTSLRWKKDAARDNAVATLNLNAPVPSMAILGDPSLVGDGNFTLTRTATGVRAEKTFASGLRIIKNFEPSSNFLVNVSVRMENRTAQPLKLPIQEWVVGTATPMDADDNGTAEGAMWYDGNGVQDCAASWFAGGGFACTRGAPKTEYLVGENNVYWAAVHNQFFALMAMPPTNLPAAQILAQPVTLPALATLSSGTATSTTTLPTGVQAALVYPGQTISANSATERSLALYAGPKEYASLARIGEEYQNHADLVMNFGTGWYTSFFGIGTFFAKALLLGMNGIHALTGVGYGWAIVIITIMLRAIFWPLTAASTRSMKRMQALAPELKELQAKYKDDVQKLTQKQWELYKKHKANPMSGCLPMLIQMPVFIGFFTMIRNAIELRGAHFLWVSDLSKPDTLAMIPGLNIPFNLLPLLMVAVMIWQAHLQPPSPGMDPGQQKMMRFMPLMLLIFLYTYSSGMALYMTVSTLAGVLQTKLTKINLPAATAVVSTSDPRLTPVSKKQK